MSTIYNRISQALAAKFIFSDELARVLALAIVSKKNVLLWGPGGHGKSEMVMEVLKAIQAEPFVQSFGEGMDEATLWGGLDFQALESEKVLRYYPEESFLASEYVIFEELFDAPPAVLLALKDTLTSRVLRKGAQKFAMRTESVIALTNKDPAEIADMGAAYQALIERFPLVLKVEWSDYRAQEYQQLFDKVEPQLGGANLNGLAPVLAELMAKVVENGDDPISPRSAIHAIGVIKTAAELRGSDTCEKEDLLDLRFVDGFEGMAETLQEDLDRATEHAAAAENIAQFKGRISSLAYRLHDASSPIKALQIGKAAQALIDELSRLKVPDSLTQERKDLRKKAGEILQKAKEKAFDLTR
jgi:MoxR-like ATPase